MQTDQASEVRVLLIDDDEDEFVIVKRHLRHARAGTMRVEWTPTPAQALAVLRDLPPDIVLLDYHLGETTGIEFLTEIRTLGFDLPVILLTGHGSLEVDLAAMQLGALDYLEKGDLTAALLERTVRYSIESYRARHALRVANAELEQRVRERTAELARSNRDLEEFARVVARDMQEPLRAMVMQIEEWRAVEAETAPEAPPSTAAALLDSLLRTARNMEVMIQNMLDYSRVARAARTPELVNLATLVREVAEELSPTLVAEGAISGVEELPVVQGDPELLRNLFANVLDNAIRFRSHMAPRIRLEAERHRNMWLVSVHDNGIGIPEEDLDDIFLMFFRGSRPPSAAGVGMGLAMCRKIVQAHGGKIWADSRPGMGSTFNFTLPAQ